MNEKIVIVAIVCLFLAMPSGLISCCAATSASPSPSSAPPVLPAGRTVHGTVLDAAGYPVPAAKVILLDDEGSKPFSLKGNPQYTRDNAKMELGEFRFDYVPDGSYMIRAEKDGHVVEQSLLVNDDIAKLQLALSDYNGSQAAAPEALPEAAEPGTTPVQPTSSSPRTNAPTSASEPAAQAEPTQITLFLAPTTGEHQAIRGYSTSPVNPATLAPTVTPVTSAPTVVPAPMASLEPGLKEALDTPSPSADASPGAPTREPNVVQAMLKGIAIPLAAAIVCFIGFWFVYNVLRR